MHTGRRLVPTRTTVGAVLGAGRTVLPRRAFGRARAVAQPVVASRAAQKEYVGKNVLRGRYDAVSDSPCRRRLYVFYYLF